MYKKYFQDKKAILFDLDGTIIDSIPLWIKAYNNIADKIFIPGVDFNTMYYGLSLNKLLKRSFSNSLENIKITVPEARVLIIDEYLKILDKTDEDNLIRDGFWDFVMELKDRKIKMGINSNSDRVIVDRVSEKLGFDKEYFDLIISGDDVKKRKPDPEIYNKSVKILGVNKHEVLVFEDSMTGAKAATKAKLETIIIWNGYINKIKYPIQIQEFFYDFENLSFYMDTDLIDETEKHRKWLEEEETRL